jgi:hypothetical protein
MKQSGFLAALGEENIARDIYAALERAKLILETPKGETFIQPSSIKNA